MLDTDEGILIENDELHDMFWSIVKTAFGFLLAGTLIGIGIGYRIFT